MERQAYIVHQFNLHDKVLPDTLLTDIDISEDAIQPVQVCDLTKIDILKLNYQMIIPYCSPILLPG